MNENRDSFSLKDVIFNLLFILLFVFILLWLFPSKSFLNGVVKTNNKTTVNQTFNHNMETMKDTAISYFTTPRLPKKIGDSVDLTLKQMIDKKLLLSLIDSNGEICDEGMSYVEITKDKDEYVLKVSLSCSDMEDYILVHLGCYDYCDEGKVCEKQEETFKYQYQLITPCKLTDFGPWSNWQTGYVVANSNRKVETRVVTDKVNANLKTSCSEGYSYNETSKKCYKNVESTEVKDAEEIINYSCEVGYIYHKESNKCVKSVTTTINIPAIKNPTTYNCDKYSNYTLSGNSCVKTITDEYSINATPIYVYSCSQGTLSADKTSCIYSYTTIDSVKPGRKCTDKLVETCNANGCEDEIVTTCYRTCPGGYKIVGSECQSLVSGQSTTNSIKTISKYVCSQGTLNGSKCMISTSSIDTKPAIENDSTYYCADKKHTLNGTMCSYEEKSIVYKNPIETKKYSCTKYGSDYSLKDKKCSKNITNTEEKDVINTYICPSGYTLNDKVCSINIIYYRYSERSCVGGSIDYKWSESDKDESLLSKGYSLTGYKEKIQSK